MCILWMKHFIIANQYCYCCNVLYVCVIFKHRLIIIMQYFFKLNMNAPCNLSYTIHFFMHLSCRSYVKSYKVITVETHACNCVSATKKYAYIILCQIAYLKSCRTNTEYHKMWYFSWYFNFFSSCEIYFFIFWDNLALHTMRTFYTQCIQHVALII